ncbi:cytochrome P450 [Penicillium angulare]|uniref:cytochrome P450 n=1 Tax=Penicillium angulare TaxID=116970 RepID=UPI002541F000|nr:cytochrome P450 [Penicillium angulare]KAJ5281822.1 cytochrome P450 [Penicillium angulare]
MAPIVWKLIQIAIVGATYAVARYGPDEGFTARVGWLGCFSILESIALFGYFVYARIIWPLYLTPLTKLPQVKGGSWLNGHFRDIFMNGTGECERRWMYQVPNEGFVYYRSLLNMQRVIVTSPQAVQHIATHTDDFKKPSPAKAIAGKVLGEGLVLAELDKHRHQRRVFMPIFAPQHIREMFPIFWGKTREVTQKLTQHVLESQTIPWSKNEGAVFEIGNWSSRAALDIIGMATLGADFGSIQDEDAPMATAYRQSIEPSRGHVAHAMLKVFIPEWYVDMLPDKWNSAQDNAVPIIRGEFRRLLRERRLKEAEKTNTGKDLLSLCFKYAETANADEEDTIDQMATFLAAGHETISVGITWSIYMLCLHPEWQPILREEARRVFPDPNADDEKNGAGVTSADLENMPMMQAFTHEVLRWLPPIPQNMREPLRDVVIDGVLIPKGTWIVVPFKGLQRDTRFWGPDAGVFNPHRFLNPDGTFKPSGGCTNKYTNLSFFQGSRSCVAQGFSKAEMACIVGAWVGRFNFELVDQELHDEEKMPITLGSLSSRPLHGLDVKWTLVDGW